MPFHRIAPGECDIRGWLVVADDGRRVGRVHDVIVDSVTLRLRLIEILLDLHLSEDEANRAVVVPIACARASAHRKQINVRGASTSDIVHAPRSETVRLSPEAEAAVRKFFLGPRPDAIRDRDDIAADVSEEERFWGLRRNGREREPYLRALELH
jgi:hypothetical protein